MTNKVRTSIYIDEKVLRQAQGICDQEYRGLSQTVEMLLKKYITTYNSLNQTTAADQVMLDLFEQDRPEPEAA